MMDLGVYNHVSIINGNTVAANTDILDDHGLDAISALDKGNASVFRITVELSQAGTFAVVVKDDGVAMADSVLNDGTALDANEVYTFVIGCRQTSHDGSAITYEFQHASAVSGGAQIKHLLVDEVRGGVI